MPVTVTQLCPCPLRKGEKSITQNQGLTHPSEQTQRGGGLTPPPDLPHLAPELGGALDLPAGRCTWPALLAGPLFTAAIITRLLEEKYEEGTPFLSVSCARESRKTKPRTPGLWVVPASSQS